MKPVRVLIVDDHEVVRVGLRTMLSRQDGINVVGEAATAKDAIAESCRLQPDVVLMDVRLSGGSGVDACRAIRDSCPATRVLFLSSYQDDEAVLAAIVGGASGYLLKQVNAEGLLRAIHAVAQGQSILDPAITQPALDPHAAPERGGIRASADDPLHPAAACPGARGRGENE